MKNILLTIFFSSCLMCLELDLSLGNAYNFISEISIQNKMPGGQDIKFASKPYTHGLKSPQYYSIRIRKNRKEIELIHHKLYFERDLPDEVDHFEITDGYNMLMLNILNSLFPSKYIDRSLIRLGLGMVITHPDVTINEKRFYQSGGGIIPTIWTDGYQVSGLSSQISLYLTKKIKKNFSAIAETKLLFANSVIHLEEDYIVNVPNISIHFLMGISFGK